VAFWPSRQRVTHNVFAADPWSGRLCAVVHLQAQISDKRMDCHTALGAQNHGFAGNRLDRESRPNQGDAPSLWPALVETFTPVTRFNLLNG
jgi:dienelactone hydrolase